MISNKHPSSSRTSGQALAEFAIIIVFLSMMMFFIVDAARVGWAWVTVQGAARAGARYASTGNSGCKTPPNRLDCVVDTVLNYMETLKLHEDPQAPWGTGNGYRIEVWGVDENNQGPWPEYPGAPGKPVIVRAYYWVPIITPFFKPIRETIPVYGQVTITNELFDSLGGTSAGVGLPPPLPAIPPAGPTPTFTPTSTPTDIPTPTPTITPTSTLVPTNTPEPSRCDTHFDDYLVAGDASAPVTGQLDVPPSGIKIYDLSETATPGLPRQLGTGTLDGPVGGHDCEGYVSAVVSPTLQANHVILVQNDFDGSWDTEVVLPGTPTPPPPTETPVPPTATPSPTATPISPYIRLDPSCGYGPQVNLTLEGYNWGNQSSPVNLFWIEDGSSPELKETLPVGHPADFVRYWQLTSIYAGTYTIEARSGSTIETASFEVPCDSPTDLMVSDPVITNLPAAANEPFQVQVSITNTGNIDTNQQFFIDVFLEPSEVYTNTIPIYQSGGYLAVNNLDGGASKTLTITLPFGFEDAVGENKEVWAMVDSLEQVDELQEWNNIGGPTFVTGIKATNLITPTPPLTGTEEIGGLVLVSYGGPTVPQNRAQVWLVDGDQVVAATISDSAANYQFTNVGTGTYTVWACIPIDGRIYSGSLPGVVPTNNFADILLMEAAGCPYYPQP
jgi:hypothetical protein